MKGLVELTFGNCCEGSIHKSHSFYFFCTISSVSLHLQLESIGLQYEYYMTCSTCSRGAL